METLRKLPIGAIDTRASGWWAMIFVLFTEAALFAYLLFSYFYLAVQPHEAGTFPQGGMPSLALALPNTFILLASSVAIQYVEWAEKPFSIASSPYGSLYFTVTGFHMAHVAVGVIVLIVLSVWSALRYFNRVRYAPIHIGALYWHFVDAVWLVIFFTFYVTPRFAVGT